MSSSSMTQVATVAPVAVPVTVDTPVTGAVPIVAPVAHGDRQLDTMSAEELTRQVVGLIEHKAAQHMKILDLTKRVSDLDQKHLPNEEEKESAAVTSLNATLVQAKVDIAQGTDALVQAKAESTRLQTIIDQMKDALAQAKAETVQAKAETTQAKGEATQAKAEATQAKKALKGILEIYVFPPL